MANYVVVSCAVCSCDLERRVSDYNRSIRRGQTKFYCQKHSNKPICVKRSCLECHLSMTVREASSRAFCSSSCSARHNNKKRRRVVFVPCLFCDTRFQLLKSKQKQFCNNQCQQDYYWELAKAEILQYKAFTGPREAKKFLIETRGHRCEICLRRRWLGEPIPLVLDHIDGNADNWHVTNFRLLCANCDAQTDTYKGRNYGFGRHSRRQRYAEGKSF